MRFTPIAERLVAARRILEHGRPVFDPHTVTVWRRRKARHQHTENLDQYEDAMRDRMLSAQELTRCGAGSDPNAWGSLSTAASGDAESSIADNGPLAGCLCLENTLTQLVKADVWAAAELLRQLSEFRVAAVLDSDPQAVRDVVDADLVRMTGKVHAGSELWWLLVGHIPAEKRPLPPRVNDWRWPSTAHHPLHPVKVASATGKGSPVDPDDYEDVGLPRPDIAVEDIASHVRGRGIASAALRHLTRFANAHHLVIGAQFAPVTWHDPAAEAWVAAWYQRAGFTAPNGWDLGARMIRTPA